MRVVVWLLVVVYAFPLCVSAQILGTGVLPVTEVGPNLFQNTVTAVQSVITAVNSVTELIPLETIVVAQDIAADMALIGEIIADAQGLLQDLATLQALFNPYELPPTLELYPGRIAEMNAAIAGARHYALKAQTLVATLVSIVGHLTGLVEGIGVLTGNMAANQTLVQVNTTMSKTLTVLTVQTASAQRPESLEQLRAEVIRAMDAEITRQYWLPYFEVQR